MLVADIQRIDFSCALFGADGGLVANAPHIPVHLGSLSHAVIYQLKYYDGQLSEGDVIMTNHPQAGGSHLPGKYNKEPTRCYSD